VSIFQATLNPKQIPSEAENNVALITDAAVITGLGDDLGTTWQKLQNGMSAIQPVRRFGVENYSAAIASCIEDLNASDGRSMIYSLLDRLLVNLGPIPPETFLITATTKAGIDSLEKIQRGVPADIRDIAPTSLIAALTERFDLTCEGINISAACASATVAVARGALMIASGRAEAVLVCCADIVTEFIFSGFSALNALSAVPCRPFDKGRQGLSLGDGAAAIVMMSPKKARQQKRKPLGKVIGWGIANDATHITAPAQSGCGLIQAIATALRMAEKKAEDISAICAHGTGTIYNDQMEMTAFKHIFGNKTVPTASIKGAIGHTLAAAGGIEVAVGLQALMTQILPPTIGLEMPMETAVGWVKKESTTFKGKYLLTTNSGFGGINAAIVLGV
jgi:3-oxoacyl-[acyl-carrier-protein] synthase II